MTGRSAGCTSLARRSTYCGRTGTSGWQEPGWILRRLPVIWPGMYALALLSQPQHASFYGNGDGCGAIVHAELGKDVEQVGLDGGFADAEILPDDLVARASGHQREHLNLPGTE